MTSSLPAPFNDRYLGLGTASFSKEHAAHQDDERRFDLESQVADAYRRLGYIVHEQQIVRGLQVDLVIERGVQKTPVEVVGTSGAGQIDRLRRDTLRLSALRVADIWSGKPIIVVSKFATPVTAHWARHQTEVSIVTLTDLLVEAAAADPAPSFETAYSAPEDIEARRAEARAEKSANLIHRLRVHDQDRDALTPGEYEALCMEVFTFLFDPNLFGFETQEETTDGANRYDFICRIAPGRPFWDNLRADFRARALLFECKNYAEPITADQIYSTERYLFSGALRTVCFLIARKGGNEGCMRAAQGAMRESGKLILVLSNLDLIAMLGTSEDQGDAENLLDERIWRFIISLPR